MPDKLSGEAKELLKQFDAESGDSLNAGKKAAADKDGAEPKEKDSKKKKFWK